MLEGIFDRVFIVRLIIGMIAAGATAWGVGWYAVDKFATGFSSSVGTLSDSVIELSRRIDTSEDNVRRDGKDDVAEVTVQLRTLSGQLSEVTAALGRVGGSLDGLDKSIVSLEQRFGAAEQRQIEFERTVMGILFQGSAPLQKTADEVGQVWNLSGNVINYTVAKSPSEGADAWLQSVIGIEYPKNKDIKRGPFIKEDDLKK